MTPQEKGKLTRERNTEARIALLRAKIEATNAARTALTMVLKREDVTPAEIIQASQLLVELGKH